MNALDVSNLSVSFRIRGRRLSAVDGVSFTLPRGEILALVGESGCGKSVTALSLLRLIDDPPGRIDGGKIQLHGRSLLELPESEMRKLRGKEISMVFQEPMTSLNPVLSVGEQIAETIRIHKGADRDAAKNAAISAMERVGIAVPKERYGDYPHQLSGGMRQRIMIAMALSCEPSVLVADEPTTALDVTVQAQILELIRGLKEKLKMSVLLITHDLGVVAEVADRVAVMYAGVIVEIADVKTLFANPLHPYTRALYRSIPPGGKPADTRLETIPGRVPVLGDIPPYCRFYDRCGEAAAVCKEGEPPLRELQPGHWVRCVRR